MAGRTWGRAALATAASVAVALGGLVVTASPGQAETGVHPWTCMVPLDVNVDTDLPAEVVAGEALDANYATDVVIPATLVGLMKTMGATDFSASATADLTVGGAPMQVVAEVPKTAVPATGALDLHVVAPIPTFNAPDAAFEVHATGLTITATLHMATGDPTVLPLECVVPTDLPAVDTVSVIPASQTALTLTPSSIDVGEDVTASATVTSEGGSPTGDVVFTWDGGGTATAALVDGTASTVISGLPRGTHDVTATYARTADFGGSSDTKSANVAVVGTTTKLALSPSSGTVGDEVSASATVTAQSGTAAGDVVFTWPGGTKTVALNASGIAQTTITGLAAGSNEVKATFAETPTFGSSSDSAKVELAKVKTTAALALTPTSATTGQEITAKATIKGDSGTPSGPVTFTWGTKSATATLAADGTASTKISGLAVGKHDVKVSYAGDATYAAASATASVTVTAPAPTAVATTTTLTLDPASATYGSDVTASAKVGAASGTPTGKVTFTWPGGTATADVVAGTATTKISGLAAGSHAVKAVYAPTGLFKASEAAGTAVVTKAATTTTVKVAPKKLKIRKKATLKITVASAAGAPDGQVKVQIVTKVGKKKKVIIRTVTLKNGQAVVKTPKFKTKGKVKVKVAYLGGTNHEASSAKKLVLTVK